MKKSLLLNLPTDEYKRLKAFAAGRGMTVTAAIVAAIRIYLTAIDKAK